MVVDQNWVTEKWDVFLNNAQKSALKQEPQICPFQNWHFESVAVGFAIIKGF